MIALMDDKMTLELQNTTPNFNSKVTRNIKTLKLFQGIVDIDEQRALDLDLSIYHTSKVGIKIFHLNIIRNGPMWSTNCRVKFLSASIALLAF